MHGEGVFSWPDGKQYSGNYVNDLKQGFGVFEWPGDKRYEGEWLAGKQHGIGVFMKGGKMKKGRWENGQRIEWIG
jgi:hypothetical protein